MCQKMYILLSVCLSIYLFLCLSLYLSIFLSIYLSIYLFIYLRFRKSLFKKIWFISNYLFKMSVVELHMVYHTKCFRLWILGCPTPDYYGEDCSLSCPQNCQESRCNIVNGTCLGCVDGYRGPNCNDGNYLSVESLCNIPFTLKNESIYTKPKCWVLTH